jgi:RNA polymerase sigma-70 factor (ECF subfamily)
MTPEYDTTGFVLRLRDGDEAARNELICYACERLRRQSRKMLRTYSDLRPVEQTDDVLQNALIRLHLDLTKGKPLESGLHFWNRATMLIRRSLLDLARKHRGRHGQRSKQFTGHHDGEGGLLQQCPDNGDGTQSLDDWSEFHQQVEALPEKEKEIFGLKWYGGLSHEEAAVVLGVSQEVVKHRWQSARCLLSQRLQDREKK